MSPWQITWGQLDDPNWNWASRPLGLLARLMTPKKKENSSLWKLAGDKQAVKLIFSAPCKGLVLLPWLLCHGWNSTATEPCPLLPLTLNVQPSYISPWCHLLQQRYTSAWLITTGEPGNTGHDRYTVISQAKFLAGCFGLFFKYKFVPLIAEVTQLAI